MLGVVCDTLNFDRDDVEFISKLLIIINRIGIINLRIIDVGTWNIRRWLNFSMQKS